MDSGTESVLFNAIMSICENLNTILKDVNPGVTLVAVSKFHPIDQVMEAYNAGQRDFGENLVQELREKQQSMPADIRWHFIGHLQTNKVKYIAPYVYLIHSIDTLHLLEEVNKQALKNNRVINCLLQIHVAAEETKFGFTIDECRQMLDEGQWRELAGVKICGLMCMATNTPDTERIRGDFHKVRVFFDEVKAKYFADSEEFAIRSYGMSHDWRIAQQEGSTMIRVGTAIFGPRQY